MNLRYLNQNIRTLLPQRYPMDFIDRLESYDVKDHQIVCLKNVTINEPYFKGHFPGEPVMPGCLIIECVAQTAGYLSICYSLYNLHQTRKYVMKHLHDSKGYLAQVERFKFIHPVKPGDSLFIKCRLIASVGKALAVYGNVISNHDTVASGSVMVAKQ